VSECQIPIDIVTDSSAYSAEGQNEITTPQALEGMHVMLQDFWRISRPIKRNFKHLFICLIVMVLSPLAARAQLACNIAGKWTDSFGFPWVINPDGLTGTFIQAYGQPMQGAPCFNVVAPVTIQVTGSHSFVATAHLLDNGQFPCDVPTWVDTLTINSSCTSAQGTYNTTENSGPETWTGAGTPVLLISSTLPAGQAGIAYPSTVLVSGGTPPYSISATGLPPGLAANSDGTVSGTPAIADSGTYQVIVSVTDSGGGSAGPTTVSLTISASTPYTITLSGLPIPPSSTTPSTALPLVATVRDSSGNAAAGATVHLKIAAVPDSGGHQHGVDTDENRTGTINGEAQEFVAPTPTDSGGAFAFNFNAPIVSGTYTIAASCDDRICAQQGPNSVDVKVDGLVLLPGPGQYYYLIGNTSVHPDNHYFSPAAKVNALILAYSYHKLFPKNPLIKFNDSSLPWGGVFDFTYDGNPRDLCATGPSCNWGPPHSQHRFGTVVDIRRGGDGVPELSVGNFENLVTKLKMAIVPEGNPSHFHVCLLGPTSCQ
jgi:hypothetical protein